MMAASESLSIREHLGEEEQGQSSAEPNLLPPSSRRRSEKVFESSFLKM